MNKATFVYAIYIRTTPERLWQALTEPEFTRSYWCGTRHDTTWEPGTPWKLMIPDGRVGDSGEIVEFNPPRRLVLTWQNQFVEAVKNEPHSRCTFELEPASDMVKLVIIHEGAAPESKLIEMVSQGWPVILSSLKSLLETGEALEATKRWPKGM